ncbi:MAG: hypothetical protein SP1CHLAM54_02030 [Chlamydiia bacterium]|nr:hypothetical protein [Chlamydiia bacterium]MCH9615121.1 hypothetical protein [Chlamydiia bacterium]MCH9628557.1 hypothetical protein [Chlamydiia bacterium]
MLTFQEIISKLIDYWGDLGCIVHQGHDVEVGAGTFNPATFLRSLGPEPYNTVYVEPSRRPQDSRYGDNPNRVQLFHQLQVIMKPSPLDIQEKYLESLELIGIDRKTNDIRFVHDDWESPTLGAWGLGWEVWLNGMEVTQFTYFQSVAGFELSPIPVELAYGLERLAMCIQGVDSIFDIQWNKDLTIGDVYKRSEVEWSHYNFETASTDMWLKHFDDYAKEVEVATDAGLPIPAYDFVMKASHAFNMLEARGVLSTTERMQYILKIRELSRITAESYMEMRKKQKFPLLLEALPPPAPVIEGEIPSSYKASDRENFLLEIGSEELPATFVPGGIEALKRAVQKLLVAEHLSFENIKTFGTPRRLTVLVEGLVSGTLSEKIEKRGPSKEVAYDEAGNLTKQGLGFLRSVGLEDAGDAVSEKDGYLFVSMEKKGVSSIAILAENLPKLIDNLHFPKKMRWGTASSQYARPIHWILALFGKKIVPFVYSGLSSGRSSRGHNQLARKAFDVKSPDTYVDQLKKNFVMVDCLERKLGIVHALENIERELGAQIIEKTRVLKEVLHLSEWPQLIRGTFKASYLRAPNEVLISEMVEHQRYFPIEKEGKLLAEFVITADNAPNDEIRRGNEKVLSARLADGVFLYDQDIKVPLEKFVEMTKKVIFQTKLGSLFEKSERVKKIGLELSKVLEAHDERVERAAHLCKADLVSELVGEFPELQGVIGRIYALHHEEDPEVAKAIEEHYRPLGDGAALPFTETGTILALADKLDNLESYFSVGLKPTSSSDPYALRRASIGMLRILIDKKINLDLTHYLSKEVLDFVKQRAKSVFEEYGFKKDEIEAAMHGPLKDPYDQFLRIRALNVFRKAPAFRKLGEVYRRAKGQLDDKQSQALDPNLFEAEEEKSLSGILDQVSINLEKALHDRDYETAFQTLSDLQEPLANLFDKVKIMADNQSVKENRLALLHKVFHHFGHLLDFGKIQW